MIRLINILKNFFIVSLFFLFINLYSNELKINGLTKLDLFDLQTLTSIDLSQNSYNEDQINIILKDLYKSDLIFDIEYLFINNLHILNIQENKLIENIFINGNQRI